MKRTLLAASLLAAASCIHATTAKQARVYFGTSDSQGIYFADLDTDTGKLSPPKLALAIAQPGFLAIHPNRQYIYATTSGEPGSQEAGVIALKIQPDGTLTRLNRQPSGGQDTCHVSVDATGQCLMAAHYGSGGVSSFKILGDGSLSPAQSVHQHEGSGADPGRQQSPHAHSIYPDPANRQAYAPDLGIDKVMIYQLDPKEGLLTPAGFAPIPGSAMGPRHMKWSADGQHAYVLNELDLSVSVFKPGAAPGSLEHLVTLSTLPDGGEKEGMTCSEIRIHPNGKFVYAANRDITWQGRDSITVFSTFQLEQGFRHIATVPAEVIIPRNFNIEPSGKWMLMGGQGSHDIALFKVDGETGLIEFSGTKIPFDGSPICVAFMPDGLD